MTITKFFRFVIFCGPIILTFSACSASRGTGREPVQDQHYLAPKLIGSISNSEITESSGLAASKCQPDVLWTHNDSGDGPFIYAMSKTGETLGKWRVPGAENTDWEDIAEFKDKAGKCFIYLGEIGDNQSKRAVHQIYRLREPTVKKGAPSGEQVETAEVAEKLDFSYADGNHDAETLMVNPKTADIYVLSKRISGPSGVYKIKSEFGANTPLVAEKLTEISVPAIPNGYLTGGDISPDGRRVIISDYTAGYELVLPENSTVFDDIWKQEPTVVELGKRKVGESACYSADGSVIYASSEGKNAPIYEIKRRD